MQQNSELTNFPLCQTVLRNKSILFLTELFHICNRIHQTAAHICEYSRSTKQTKEEITRMEASASAGGAHDYRQQVQSPKFGFDAEVASATAVAAAAALSAAKGFVFT